MTETEPTDDQEYKAAVRREWTMAAPGWERWFDTTEARAAGRVITLRSSGRAPALQARGRRARRRRRATASLA